MVKKCPNPLKTCCFGGLGGSFWVPVSVKRMGKGGGTPLNGGHFGQNEAK
jgi:hypothetical protein